MIQEALTNTLKHAGGTTATVRLDYGPAALEVEVRDDGSRRAGEQVSCAAQLHIAEVARMQQRRQDGDTLDECCRLKPP